VDLFVLSVFAFVYAGMIAGEVPGLGTLGSMTRKSMTYSRGTAVPSRDSRSKEKMPVS
jgi:hypothetical protein